jgi:hypothetical protein
MHDDMITEDDRRSSEETLKVYAGVDIPSVPRLKALGIFLLGLAFLLGVFFV